MDNVAGDRNIVKQVILLYAKLRPSRGNIRLDTVFDETQDRYALMQVGWLCTVAANTADAVSCLGWAKSTVEW